MEHINFKDLLLEWLGEDTFLLYGPVCRAWAAAYPKRLTHPRHLVGDRATFDRYREDMWNLDSRVIVARYGCADVLALYDGDDMPMAIEAAKFGNKAGVQRFAATKLKKTDRWELYEIAGAAAEGGHLDILELTGSNHEDLFMAAGRGGHLPVLEWMVQTGEWDFGVVYSPAPSAAERGHRHVFEWLDSRGYSWMSEEVIDHAALGGHLELIQHLIAVGCPFNPTRAAWNATEGGHLSTLEWILTGIDAPPEGLIKCAAEGGHRHVVQWLRAHGCAWDEGIIGAAMSEEASDRRNFVQWLIDAGCPIVEHDSAICASNGRLDILKILHAEGGVLSDDIYRLSIVYNHESIMKWAFDHHAPCGSDEDDITMLAAISCGRDMRIIKWLHDVVGYSIPNYLINSLTMYKGDLLELFQWLYEKGFRFDAYGIYENVIRKVRSDVLELVDFLWHTAKCPMLLQNILTYCKSDSLTKHVKNNKKQVLQWIYGNIEGIVDRNYA